MKFKASAEINSVFGLVVTALVWKFITHKPKPKAINSAVPRQMP